MPLSDLFAALRWWWALMFIGAVATPLTMHLFWRLPEKGYAFAKTTGVLLVSFLFWLLASMGWLANNSGGILAAVAATAALSTIAWRKRGREIGGWLRRHMVQVLLTELVFAAVFGLWVWVRSQNPAIAATEKPMEFAFLNAIGRSDSFPPLDPWLSGFAISYYYFGYVMTSLIARMAVVAEPVAFNLGIAWLVAATAVSAFGLVYNIIARNLSRKTALLLGLVGATALPIAGNLQIGLELLHANGVGSPQVWQWLDVRDLNGPAQSGEPRRYESSSWWWWRSSRVIHEYHLSGRAEEGLEPIAEFPGFSFVLGDMHPHVLALPFAFLSLALAFTWWLRSIDRGIPLDGHAWDGSGWLGRARQLVDYGGAEMGLFTAVVLGGLSFLNTWDVLIHLFVLLGAFFLGQWYAQGWHRRILTQTATLGTVLVIAAVVLYLPFYIGFRSQAGAPFLLPQLMRPTRLAHFLVIFGLPLWSIGLLLASLVWKQRLRFWRSGLLLPLAIIAALTLLAMALGWIIASSAEGAGRVLNLAEELEITLPLRPESAVTPIWGLSLVGSIFPKALAAKLAAPWLILLLGSVLGASTMVWLGLASPVAGREGGRDREAGDSPPVSSLPFVLLLIGTGSLLAMGPEFVYIRDNFGVRLNTVFKFYYQAWVMYGTAGLFGLGYLWHQMAVSRQRLLPLLATTGYGIGLAIALLFPLFAVRSRATEYRGSIEQGARQPATLDGLAQVARFDPDEYAAIQWLRQNVEGSPVIVEAVGGQYSSYARISASTGLPTILGWAGHELQWRGSRNPEPGLRDPVVRQIYTSTDWQATAELLNRYQVEYIYVGRLESTTYGPRVYDKFSDRLQLAFQNESVSLYRWQPQ